jgi:hypothetical protein
MNTLFIILQFGASMSDPLSNTQLTIFWGIIVLLVASFVFFLIRTNKIIDAKNQTITQKEGVNPSKQFKNDVHEEEAAAIALAIHMYQSEVHDKESFTITLKKVSKIYSPWSSKIYTLRQNPR